MAVAKIKIQRFQISFALSTPSHISAFAGPERFGATLDLLCQKATQMDPMVSNTITKWQADGRVSRRA